MDKQIINSKKNVGEFSRRQSAEWTISKKMTEQEDKAERKQEELGKGN